MTTNMPQDHPENSDGQIDVGALRLATPATVAGIAQLHGLPVGLLEDLGWGDITYNSKPAIRIPYDGKNGGMIAIRYCTSINGAKRFEWKNDAKPCLYGLSQIWTAYDQGFVILTEGEIDVITLWHHGLPAIGVPEPSAWTEDWSKDLSALKTIYAMVEPGAKGKAFLDALSWTPLCPKIRVVPMSPLAKSIRELHLESPADFQEIVQELLEKATELPDAAAQQAERKAVAAAEAWPRCKDIAEQPDILAEFVKSVERGGVAGETRALQLLYLIMTSRVLESPICTIVKGQSAIGKNYIVEHVSWYFPDSAMLKITSASPKALIYSDEDLSHRALLIYEAAGINSDFAAYILRSLMSEGHVKYLSVQKTEDGLAPRSLDIEGPTAIILTTTLPNIHPENETRMLSIPLDDSQRQTKAIMLATAKSMTRTTSTSSEPLETWKDLQNWIEGTNHDVEVSFALDIAALTLPISVEMRRAFPRLVNLVYAHAILHQATRLKTDDGHILATYDDYAAVRELVGDLIARASGARVPTEVRELVETVRQLSPQGLVPATANDGTVGIGMVAKALYLDASTVERRAAEAQKLGYLKDVAPHGAMRKLQLGSPMPDDTTLFPTVEELKAFAEEDQGHTTWEMLDAMLDTETGEITHLATDALPQVGKCAEEYLLAPSPPQDDEPQVEDFAPPAPPWDEPQAQELTSPSPPVECVQEDWDIDAHGGYTRDEFDHLQDLIYYEMNPEVLIDGREQQKHDHLLAKYGYLLVDEHDDTVDQGSYQDNHCQEVVTDVDDLFASALEEAFNASLQAYPQEDVPLQESTVEDQL